MHLIDALGTGILVRRRRIEAIDVGQQHQAVGRYHAGNPGGEPVVVAIADVCGGHRVVLVDDGDCAMREQGVDRAPGIEIAAALLGVAEREQDLGGLHAALAEDVLVGVRERDLADGGRGLALLQFQRATGQAEDMTADRNGTGRDDDHFLAGAMHRGDVVGERIEPRRLELAGVEIDQQGRADLDDDPAGIGPNRVWLVHRVIAL